MHSVQAQCGFDPQCWVQQFFDLYTLFVVNNDICKWDRWEDRPVYSYYVQCDKVNYGH